MAIFTFLLSETPQHMKRLLFIYSIILFSATAFAQPPTKEELQRKTQDLNREIEEIRANLAKTGNDKKETIRYRLQLSRKIDARNQIIENIKGEVYYIGKDIIRNYREIDTLKKELDTLKAQYAKSIVYAYKNRSNYDFLNFLFSAGTFNDALKRIAYLKNYRQYREQQAGQIKKTNELLQTKVENLTGKRQDKGKALVEQSKQMNELAEDKKEQDLTLTKLQKTENELGVSMQKKQKQKQDISRAIKKIIDDEIAKARKIEQDRIKREKDRLKKYNDSVALANKKNNVSVVPPLVKLPTEVTPKTKRPPSELENTPEGIITSAEFEKNKGNLPWPVDQKFVTFHFGANRIPAKPRDIIENRDGVTMETGIGASVKAIFEGEVTRIYNVADVVLVVIKHGKYFSAYNNLSSSIVKEGQKIVRGQAIGKAGINDDGVGEMELLITNEKGNYLNPESWIRR